MHIGKVTTHSQRFRTQIWNKILNREIDGVAFAKDVVDEAEVRLYAGKKIMLMSPEFLSGMYRDAVLKYHMSAWGSGFSLAGVPVYRAESVEEFTRLKPITESSRKYT